MVVQDIMKNITDRITTATQVEAVFGEPRTIGKKTIIPIAANRMGFGAGGGEACEEGSEKGSGGGGGGGAAAKPLAILEVTDEETKLIPIIDMTRVIVGSLMFATATVYMLSKLIGRKNNK